MHSNSIIHKYARLAGIILATVLWISVLTFSNFHFDVNDDQFILRSLIGGSSVPAFSFHFHVQSFITAPLVILGRFFPLVPWFSVLLIALMWLSSVTIVKSIIMCFSRKPFRHAFFIGIFFALCFLLLYQYYISTVLTYSTVAAALSAAAAAQLMTIDCQNASDKHIIISSLYSLVLLVIGYGLRDITVLPGLGFCGIVFIYRFFTCFGFGRFLKRSAKPMLIVLVTVIITIGGLFAARQAEIAVRNQQSFVAWQQARIDVIDYIDLHQISEKTLEQIGWTSNDVQLLEQWYTLDSMYETKDFQHIANTHKDTKRYATPGIAIEQFRLHHPLIFATMIVLILLGGVCLIGIGISSSCRHAIVALCAVGSLCGILLLYLAWTGRLIVRSSMVAVLPAAALLFCLFPECLLQFQSTSRFQTPLFRRLFLFALCMVVSLCTVFCFIPIAHSTRYIPPKWDYNTYAARDAAALNNPDLLFIYSGEIVNDLRVFPDFSKGIPANLLTWGGWMSHSEEYNAKLKAFGLDGEQFSAQSWLHPSVRLLTLDKQPKAELLTYLQEKLEQHVFWEGVPVDEALWSYRFYTGQSTLN